MHAKDTAIEDGWHAVWLVLLNGGLVVADWRVWLAVCVATALGFGSHCLIEDWRTR